ncbi:MAG: hypothetical protein J5713_03580, partial [Clostridia bacterium]|nr:hypothetical protein [Clostridia bacterium]
PVLFWTVDSEENVALAQQFANNIIFEKIGADRAEEVVGTFKPIECEEQNRPQNFERKGKLKPL